MTVHEVIVLGLVDLLHGNINEANFGTTVKVLKSLAERDATRAGKLLATAVDEIEADAPDVDDLSDWVRACRVCGYTDDDCSQCVEATGKRCSWVEADLCSRCADEEASRIAANTDDEPADDEIDTRVPQRSPQTLPSVNGRVHDEDSDDEDLEAEIAAMPPPIADPPKGSGANWGNDGVGRSQPDKGLSAAEIVSSLATRIARHLLGGSRRANQIAKDLRVGTGVYYALTRSRQKDWFSKDEAGEWFLTDAGREGLRLLDDSAIPRPKKRAVHLVIAEYLIRRGPQMPVQIMRAMGVSSGDFHRAVTVEHREWFRTNQQQQIEITQRGRDGAAAANAAAATPFTPEKS